MLQFKRFSNTNDFTAHFYPANFHLPACETYPQDLCQTLSGNIYNETRKTIGFAFVSRPRITNSLQFKRAFNMRGIVISSGERLRDLFENRGSLRVAIPNDSSCPL